MKAPRPVALLAAFPVFWFSAAPALAVPAFDVNLIVNGDAETGAAAPDLITPVSIPGWTKFGASATVINYGTAGGPKSTDPGPADRGNSTFAGGQFTAVLAQDIALSGLDTKIDDGKVTFDLAAFLGGFGDTPNTAQVRLFFLDQNSDSFGTTTVIGPVTSADRGNVTGLLPEATSGPVPFGARFASVAILFTPTFQAFADNVSLILREEPTLVPLPGTLLFLGLGAAAFGVREVRRRLRRRPTMEGVAAATDGVRASPPRRS